MRQTRAWRVHSNFHSTWHQCGRYRPWKQRQGANLSRGVFCITQRGPWYGTEDWILQTSAITAWTGRTICPIQQQYLKVGEALYSVHICIPVSYALPAQVRFNHAKMHSAYFLASMVLERTRMIRYTCGFYMWQSVAQVSLPPRILLFFSAAVISWWCMVPCGDQLVMHAEWCGVM